MTINRGRKLVPMIVLAVAIVGVFGCKRKPAARNRLDENHFPRIILWAWERPEDLKALDPNRFGVAFLAQTLILKNEQVVAAPRRQPFDVPPGTKLIAVTRIESSKTSGERAELSDSQREKAAALILQTLALPNVSALQIDFDATQSERAFYRALLQEVRSKLPDQLALSITALASFCVGDRWLEDLPVDEAVPMIFRMGADDRPIRNLLAAGDDFREPLCQRSYGVAIDEPPDFSRDPSRRVYVFNTHSWSESKIAALQQSWLK